jgi:hypothetical protein
MAGVAKSYTQRVIQLKADLTALLLEKLSGSIIYAIILVPYN